MYAADPARIYPSMAEAIMQIVLTSATGHAWTTRSSSERMSRTLLVRIPIYNMCEWC